MSDTQSLAFISLLIMHGWICRPYYTRFKKSWMKPVKIKNCFDLQRFIPISLHTTMVFHISFTFSTNVYPNYNIKPLYLQQISRNIEPIGIKVFINNHHVCVAQAIKLNYYLRWLTLLDIFENFGQTFSFSIPGKRCDVFGSFFD